MGSLVRTQYSELIRAPDKFLMFNKRASLQPMIDHILQATGSQCSRFVNHTAQDRDLL
jgi:hypothetical protein